MPKNSVNMNDYSTAEIDKLFETLDRETISKMTGTGSGLAKKAKKTTAKKTTATKKKTVKRK